MIIHLSILRRVLLQKDVTVTVIQFLVIPDTGCMSNFKITCSPWSVSHLYIKDLNESQTQKNNLIFSWKNSQIECYIRRCWLVLLTLIAASYSGT